MVSARRPLDAPVVWSLAIPFAVLTLGTGLQIDAPDSSPSTMIEQALIEHRCSAMRPAGMPETDAYRECLNTQLLSLRTDFGRDLKRLSGAERNTIDSFCHRIREAQGPDAYLACLSKQFALLGSRHRRTNPDPSVGATPPPPLAEATLPPLPPPVSNPPTGSTTPMRSTPWPSSVLWIGAGLAAVLLAAGGVLATRKTERAPRHCGACGTDISEGDLCAACRHEAAEARRRLATERADQQRAQEEERRRQREQEEEQHRERGDEEEKEARPQEADQARARQEAQTRHDEPLRMPREKVAKEAELDPHAILGVSRDASKEDILAAYQQAKMKYDVDQVSHLGVDVREHYIAKTKAVERAYQQLTK